jgi:hypothetical protein
MEMCDYSGNASANSRDIIVAAKAVATLQLLFRQTTATTTHDE